MRRAARSAEFFRTALIGALVAYTAVVFGSYVRLSRAVVGCPAGPGCYGGPVAPVATPALVSTGALVERGAGAGDAWRQTTERYIALALVLVLVRLAILGLSGKRRARRRYVVPGLAVLFVIAMTMLGVLDVGAPFRPMMRLAQLLGGLLVLGMLWWLAMREQRFWRSLAPNTVTRSLRGRALFALALVVLEIALGGWAMVHHAGLACSDFPTCQGVWWPPMDFVAGFTPWRAAGLGPGGRLLDLPAATAIHMAHRVGALIVLLYVGWLALHVLRVGTEQNLCRYGMVLLVMLGAQVTLGILQVEAHWPLAVALAHGAVAPLLLLSLITLYHAVRPPATR